MGTVGFVMRLAGLDNHRLDMDLNAMPRLEEED